MNRPGPARVFPLGLLLFAGPLDLTARPAGVSSQVAASENLPDIVVTAGQAALLSGSVLDSEKLLAVPQRSLDGVLRALSPGFRLFRRADSFTAHPTSQGVTLGNVSPNGASRAVVLLDGIPVNDPFGGWIAWSRFPVGTLSAVAISPNGSPGNLIPGMPGGTLALRSRVLTDSPFVWVEAATGDRLQRDLTLAFAEDTQDGRTRLFGSVHTQNFTGYPVIREDTRGSVDIRAFSRSWAADGGVRHRLAEQSDWNLTLRTQVWEEHRGNGTPLANNHSDAADFSLRLEKQGAPGEWAGSWTAFHQRREFSSTFTSIAAGRNTETLSLDQFAVPTTASGLIQALQFPVGDAHLLTLGSDLRVTEGTTHERFRNLGAGFTRERAAGGEQTDGELSLSDTWLISPELTFTSALRAYTHRDENGHLRESDTATGALLRSQPYPTRQNERIDFGLATRWTPNAALQFGASVFSTHRYPTLNELYRPFRVGDTSTLANPELRPETLLGTDATARWQCHKRVALRGRVFLSQLRDGVANVSLVRGPGTFGDWGFLAAGTTGARRENLDSIRTHGLEAGAEITLPGSITLEGGWIYTTATIREARIQPGLEGLTPAQLPRHQASLALRGGDTRWRWQVGVRYCSGQFEDDLNQRRLEDYVSVDAMLTRQVGKGREVFLGIENLTDTEIQSRREADGTIGITNPRSWTAGVRCEF